MGFFSSELFTSQLEAADKVEIGLFSSPEWLCCDNEGKIQIFFAGPSLKSKFEGLHLCSGTAASPGINGMCLLVGMRGKAHGMVLDPSPGMFSWDDEGRCTQYGDPRGHQAPGIGFKSQIWWVLSKFQPCLGGNGFHGCWEEPEGDPRMSLRPQDVPCHTWAENSDFRGIWELWSLNSAWFARENISVGSAGNGNCRSGN